MRRARGDDLRDIDAGGQLGDLLDQGVAEDVLRDGDGDGAAERVEEDGDRVARRHVLLVQHDLHGDEGDLHAGARADAREDLEADPRGGAAADFQRVQHAAADGEDGRAGPREGDVGAERGDGAADDDAGERDGDEVGDRADAAAFGCRAFHGLEVEGEVEDVRVEAHAEEGGEEGACQYRALSEDDPRWKCGPVAEVELEAGEDADQDNESQYAAPDFGVFPRVDRASPLKSQEQADNGADQEEGAQ